MSLIDSTYFSGPIMIPQLGQPAVVEEVDNFINRFETAMLQACLGYQLWEDFITGLSQIVIEQKWLDLRDGVKFTATGMWPPFYWQYPYLGYYRQWYIPQNPVRPMYWVGFAPASTLINSGGALGSLLVLTCGQTVNDPSPGTSTFTLARLAGSSYWIERRGFGTMIEGVDVSITNNAQTITLLKAGDKFNLNEIFVLHFLTVSNAGIPSPIWQSPVASYIYYQYTRDQVTQNTGVGIVSTTAENATNSSAWLKMQDAFNYMSKQAYILWLLLEAKGTNVYASYDRLKIDYSFFKPINRWNL